MSSWPHLQASTVSYSLIINDPMLDEGPGCVWPPRTLHSPVMSSNYHKMLEMSILYTT